MPEACENGSIQVGTAETTRVFERARLPCATHLVKVNVASGCSFGCLFCPVRCRGIKAGQLLVYTNLAHILEHELAIMRKNRLPPPGVLLNPATDTFQPFAPLLTLSFEVARLLLESGCSIHFRTRGVVPEGFADLFRAHRDLINAEVTFVSMDADIVRVYEPGASHPQQRLESVRRLRSWGIDVRARIEPLMPFITDTVGHLEDLTRHLRSAGIDRAATSYLVLRPQVVDRLQQALPAAHFHMIKGCFKGQAWRKVGLYQMTKTLPERLRSQGYQRLRAVANRVGLNVHVCSCLNPGLGEACIVPPVENSAGSGKGQLDLFPSA